MNKKRCHTLPLVQLLPTVAVAAAVLLPCPAPFRCCSRRAGKADNRGGAVCGGRFLEAEEGKPCPSCPMPTAFTSALPGNTVCRPVQITMGNGSITEVEILDASHETKQFLQRANGF